MNHIGYVVIALIVVAATWLLGYSACQKNYMRPLINQCEAELPRDQHCKLTAVPEVGE